MAKKNRIVQPGDNEAVQLGLFSAANTGDIHRMADYPKVYRDEEGFKKVVSEVTDMCGLDFEFNTRTLKPTVIGVSNYVECAAVWFTPEILAWLESERKARGFIYSGHAVLTADRQVLETAAGGPTELTDWSDSMLTFWMANADLCKAPGKETDEEGGLGFMGLGTMGSLTTDLPHHKTCRGRNCEELICPRHDVRGYCAVDAFVGLLGDRRSRQDLEKYLVPSEAITFTHELQEVAKLMQDLGVYIDREYVASLGAKMAEQQEKLFPAKGEEGYIFNPRSPKEVSDWFRERKVYLASTDKDNVQTALEKLAAEHGFTAERFEDLRERLAAEENLDPTLDALFRLYTYKVLGKGTDSWFHAKYFDKAGLVHPRFVTTGTSTGRFSSASPNFQNCPKRGWGKLVRKAVVPRDPGNIIVEADYSQLELRICLYLAGVDQSVIGEDAFSWLVSKSGGLFDKAAQRYGGKPRDIAKSVSHGSNYLEGLRLIPPDELTYARTKNEIVAGALRVYHPDYTDRVTAPWVFGGKIVAFTGSNLAQRLFGSKTLESRKKALEIQEDIYFAAFPQIRRWQQEVTVAGDLRGYAAAPTGRFLRLNDMPEKNMKLIVAFLGQGVGASHMQAKIVQYYKERGLVFMCTIHDALVREFPLAGGYAAIYDQMQFMAEATPLLPGFTCPIKIEVGKTWGAMEELFKHSGRLYVGEEKKKETWREVE